MFGDVQYGRPYRNALLWVTSLWPDVHLKASFRCPRGWSLYDSSTLLTADLRYLYHVKSRASFREPADFRFNLTRRCLLGRVQTWSPEFREI